MTHSPKSAATDAHEFFVQQCRKHEVIVRTFAGSLVRDFHGVETVLRDTFEAAWSKYDPFQAETNFRLWICTIAREEALRYLRERGKSAALRNETLIDMLQREAGERIDADARQKLQGCLNQLPERAREWLRQAYDPSKTFAQVAKETGHSIEACHKMVQRLRQELLDCLRRSSQEGEAA